MDEFDVYGEKLNTILLEEANLLSVILEKQRAIRNCVNNKEWVSLEQRLDEIFNLSGSFQELEKQREQHFAEIASLTGVTETGEQGFYTFIRAFSPRLREDILRNFRTIRQDLVISRIENNSLDRYIASATALLKGLFEDVVPQRRNKIYSRRGTIAAREPDSLIFNQSL
ncbi:MAG: hypothetical protein LBR47_04425 [Spirochaetaceae bacterium]|jgi:hypothetical protein|nr:hypothetical protein [Spirochaetaceae bacterium]